MYHYAGNNPVKYTDPDGNVCISYFDSQIGKYNIRALDQKKSKMVNIFYSVLDFYPFGIGDFGKSVTGLLSFSDSRIVESSLAKGHYIPELSKAAGNFGKISDAAAIISKFKPALSTLSNCLGNISSYVVNPALLGLSVGEGESWIIDNLVVSLCNTKLAAETREGAEEKYAVARDVISSCIKNGDIKLFHSTNENKYIYDVIKSDELKKLFNVLDGME